MIDYGRYTMKIKIIKSLLPRDSTLHRYMYRDGKMDYLGQILTQLGHNVEGKHRFPSSMGKLIPPFTQQCRGSIIDSKITLSILALDHSPRDTHEQVLRDLLPNYEFTFVS